ncbi:MAG: 16S rRNA (cytosine(1402)-N(4))-methyltransferase [Clostridiales bacterium 43-6]|nr:MAG: 16S rRNA (cytosine(1402)-N(4))-methyltransferase [Clostridiales bacterium 43-6]
MFSHKSVLLEETLEALEIKPNGIYVDGTLGGGGHSGEILKRLEKGKLIGIDQDPDAIAAAKEKFRDHDNIIIVQNNFSSIDEVLDDLKIHAIDGLLLDLGVSSHQLDTKERGFSYHMDAYLDMRMSKEGASAADLCNTLSAMELARIFFDYGEEKFSFKIANAIVKNRPVTTTKQLADIIAGAYPAAKRKDGHPARKVFQALRIAVNNELDVIPAAIRKAFSYLNKDGIIAVITFHSLEDRIVKRLFAEYTKGCTCPPEFPICICGNTPKAELTIKKPVTAGQTELEQNNRSRSAKLRALRKL